MHKEKIFQGIDQLISKGMALARMRTALVTNDAAMAIDGEPARVALLNNGFKIIKLFSPEHGLSAMGVDGAFQENIVDPLTELPVTSLYGDSLMPQQENLKDIDLVLFDIPDVGCRFYTYLWTMTHVMEACAKNSKPMILLDRSNPIGGRQEFIEGPMLDENHCSSFIGRWNIPLRHGCSFGELAKYFAATRVKDLELHVIEVQNWKRESLDINSKESFIPPSPAIRDPETAFLYPGNGLLEGINVNEGRGTATPFKVCAAPWIDALALQKRFEELEISGIHSDPVHYSPADGIYAGQSCHGLRFKIIDTNTFRPVYMGLQLIGLIKSIYSDECQERLYPTRANPAGTNHLDRLTGVYKAFDKIGTGELLELSKEVGNWKEEIKPHLLY